ncbi:MAG: hypothetical protein ACJATT_004284 [Myxococcota bacterium]|jgi:hypothetical protein
MRPTLWLGLSTLGLTACSGAKQPLVTAVAPVAVDKPVPEWAGWTRIEPEAGTMCSDGSAYSFFAREADPTKLLVYFQGGGACWNGETCSQERIGSYRPVIGDTDPADSDGIFALDNPSNPFADYSMVFVSYCTGDVHLGDSEVTYHVSAAHADQELDEGQDPAAHSVTIQHKGHHNAMTVLAWTYAQFEAADTIFVAGSSAGSIPSPYFGSHLATQYPNAQLAVLGDAAGGYRGSADGPMFDRWNTLEAIGVHEAYADVERADLSYAQLYIEAAQHRQDLIFAQYDTAEDSIQRRFLAMSGAESTSLLPMLDANHSDIGEQVSNVKSYVAAGDQHTVLRRPDFYTIKVADVALRDWVASLARGEALTDVHCGWACTTED